MHTTTGFSSRSLRFTTLTRAMEACDKAPLFLCLFFSFFFFGAPSTAGIAPSVSDRSLGDLPCKLVSCVQGTCHGSLSNLPFFFDCDCYPGWTKVKIGDLVIPPCILPNCSLHFENCALPPFSLPKNFSNLCDLIWCGDGTCVPGNGTGHMCVCNDGAYNLNESQELPCFKECSLGGDCTALGFSPPQPPPMPPPPPPLAPSPSKGNPARGWTCRITSYCYWMRFLGFTMFALLIL